MCGILATYNNPDKIKFEFALTKLSHRGPDGHQIIHDNEVSLGHTRLSIIDLSENGDQPMKSRCGRYTITFNGEIYNYIEIREILKKKGHVFISKSDTEVILNSFIEWGHSCLDKFNGMWSFVIWDKQQKRFFISRDRYGKKPLYYYQKGDQIVFASEMKALIPFMNDVKPSKNFHIFKDQIFNYENTEECLIDQIKRFPKGSFAYFEPGKLKIERFYNTLDNVNFENKNLSYQDQIEVFRELFFDSTKLRMRSDVPVGTALSGGLDSSSVLAAMHSVYKEDNLNIDWQNAFVASFPGTPLDETKYAKKISEYCNIENTYFLDIDPLNSWDKIEDYFYLFEDLYITSPIPMIQLYSKVREKGLKVTIDGHGADELLCGYGHILDAIGDTMPNYFKSYEIAKTYKDTLSSSSQFIKGPSYLSIITKQTLKHYYRKFYRGEYSSDSNHQNFKKLDSLGKSLYYIFHESILPTLLRNYDRYSMINGVEIRMPFMDHRVVEFLFSIGYESKVRNGFTKSILRDSMQNHMPNEITYRKSKIGFNTPIVDWMQKDLKDWFLDTVYSSEFKNSELIQNRKSLTKRVEKTTSGQISDFGYAQETWKQLSVFLWEKSFLNYKN
jgi:asparagine synthase (glutamine-hydrolysing)